MKTLYILTVIFTFLSVQEIYAQQDIQNANAPKLLPMEKIENPKKQDKQNGKNTTTITKVNAPVLNATGTIIQESPRETTPTDNKNTPVLSNQNQITVPKKDKE